MKKICIASRKRFNDEGEEVRRGMRAIINIVEVENSEYKRLVENPAGRFVSLTAAMNGFWYVTPEMEKKINEAKDGKLEILGNSKRKRSKKQKPAEETADAVEISAEDSIDRGW